MKLFELKIAHELSMAAPLLHRYSMWHADIIIKLLGMGKFQDRKLYLLILL